MEKLRPESGKIAAVLYFAAVTGLVARIAVLDEWSPSAWALLLLLVATFGRDRVARPTRRSLALGVGFFGLLSGAVAYLPDLWFGVAYRLNHGEHYLWNANAFMTALPLNDGRFLWAHSFAGLTGVMRWIYLTGFDMVVWIPVVRSLLAFDSPKMARYALGAHLVQFPLIMPFYATIRVDEVWSVLGHADRCQRGWTDEIRRDLGANCFPSMHTSVAFAVLLLALRERSRVFRVLMAAYATSIVVSTVYMEIHWLVDVAGGLALGAVAVRIADALVARLSQPSRSTERDPVLATAPATRAAGNLPG